MTLRQTLFISDLHLSESSHHLNALFDTFIENVQRSDNVDAVYILGDFFDVWTGDDLMTSWSFDIAKKLASLKEIPVYFMPGNRDFLIGGRFAEMAGCSLISDPSCIDLYGNRVLLKHGDDLCVKDRLHQFFRRFSRNIYVQKCYLALPSSWRQKIAGELRRVSRGNNPKYNNGRSSISMPMVHQLLKENEASTLIHGHIHDPQMELLKVGNTERKYIVLCDWREEGNCLRIYSNGRNTLDYFKKNG